MTSADVLATLYLAGTTTNLRPGDPLLFAFGEGAGEQVVRWVEGVEVQQAERRTKIALRVDTTPIDARRGEPASVRLAAYSPVASIRDRLAPYLNVEAFGVSPTTRTARDIVALLSDFLYRLTPATTADEAAGWLHEVTSTVSARHAEAVVARYTRLEPWLREILTEAEQLLRHLGSAAAREDSDDVPARPEIENCPGANGDGRSATTELEDLIAPLLKPPSRPPANRQRLVRSVDRTFSAAGDAGLQLLVGLRPGLKDTLHEAYEKADVTPPPELEGVQAFRVKAAVFGHNAPLKPILDPETGVTTDYDEWPTAERTTIGLELSTGHDAIVTDVSIRRGVEESTGQRTLQVTGVGVPIEVGPFTVNVTASLAGDVLKMLVKLQDFGRQLQLDGDPSEKKWTVRFDTDPALEAAFDTTSKKATRESELEVQAGKNGWPLILSVDFPLKVLALDAEYDQITPGSWVIIERANPGTIVARVEEARSVSRADYGITGRVTQLTLDRSWLTLEDRLLSNLRRVTVYARSELLGLTEEQVEEAVRGGTVELDRVYDGLESGRWLIVSGERTDIPGTSGVRAAELVMLGGVAQSFDPNLLGDRPRTALQLSTDLAYTYKRDTVSIYGNVAKATHGETRTEVLGSGDAAKTLQSFTLRQPPLTYVSAPTPAGAESTLVVRVNDVRWPEKESLAALDRDERGFLTRTGDDQKTTVVFGNGERGARLPTGVENVSAVYRTGIGKVGNVAAERITLLATRPLGVKGVTNPLRASGGADRETRDQARRSAPLSVTTLGRLVSVQDYEDFARTFAGVGKASAVRLTDGERRVVHVTIAGADDIPIDESSDLFGNLLEAFRRFGDPCEGAQVAVRALRLVVMGAKVRVHPDYRWESVEPEVRLRLLEALGFERRELGQDVRLSEAIAAVQAVEGVTYVDVDFFDALDEERILSILAGRTRPDGQPERVGRMERIPVRLARVNPSAARPEERIEPAELAYLSPDAPESLIVTEMGP